MFIFHLRWILVDLAHATADDGSEIFLNSPLPVSSAASVGEALST